MTCIRRKALVAVLAAAACLGAAGGKDKPLRDSVSGDGWTFYTDGPVRYAPARWEGRLYVGSDDGHVYCLDAADGRLIWKHFAGPSNRKLLGNGRLISAWGISGGPVVHDGKVYFAAGTWPVMGVLVCCLDAADGKVVWINDNNSAYWSERDNIAGGKPRPSFVSVAPKGKCFVSGDRLAVPCGRAAPAWFDLKTGRLVEFRYGRVKRFKPGDGSWPYPDFDALARRTRGCFPDDATASKILEATGIRDGYCLVTGVGDGRLVEGLLGRSMLRIVAVDPDPKKVAALRKRLDAKGLYGSRAAAHVGDPLDFGLPPYLFSLIVAADAPAPDPRLVRTVFRSLRPYGGTACLVADASIHAKLVKAVRKAGLAKAELSRAGALTLLKRAGALAGSDDWSHEQANSCNTLASSDRLVRAPLGVLWYGGPAGDIKLYYEQHRQRGYPKVAGGRMFVEGPRIVTAFDVYTGRRLWTWKPPADDEESWFEIRQTRVVS
ncbi:MAG: outer membrane protein assembly factor BamB family protein, partial [Planctomycetota bacterium]